MAATAGKKETSPKARCDGRLESRHVTTTGTESHLRRNSPFCYYRYVMDLEINLDRLDFRLETMDAPVLYD